MGRAEGGGNGRVFLDGKSCEGDGPALFCGWWYFAPDYSRFLSTPPVIGLLDPRTPDAMADRLRAFRLGLKDVGYVEGENVTIIYRFAEDQHDRLPELAAELVRRRVTVIAASATPAAIAAKPVTTTIP